MAGKEQLSDMIVVVPGILGSVLKYKNGSNWENIWNPSSAGFLGGRIVGIPLDRLTYSAHEPKGAVQATDLIRIPFGLRGLLEGVGYDALARQLKSAFEIETGRNGCSNYHEFPYDWRQDNAKSGEQLKEFVDERLALWQDETGDKDARVIFLAHSMGGLVCRHFLEVLEGWRRCRMLVTFATPFRGSLNALRYLVNGYHVGSTDVSKAMLSMPALYQLLPIYPVMSDGSKWTRPWETDFVKTINPELVGLAQEFHQRLLSQVDWNMTIPEYQSDGYFTYPMVGTDQPTDQQAVLDGGRLTLNDEMPPDLSKLPRYGDSTVPHCSAIPVEVKNKPVCHYVPEKHGFMHANERSVEEAVQSIVTVQSNQLQKARGILEERIMTGPPAFSLTSNVTGAVIEVIVEQRNVASMNPVDVVVYNLTESGKMEIERREIPRDDGRVMVELPVSGSGCYEIEVRSIDRANGPSPVHDLVEIL